MANKNCLIGMKCLNCGSEGPFMIHSMVWLKVEDDGTGEYYSPTWGEGSSCTCCACDFRGTVGECTIANIELAKAKKEMET